MACSPSSPSPSSDVSDTLSDVLDVSDSVPTDVEPDVVADEVTIEDTTPPPPPEPPICTFGPVITSVMDAPFPSNTLLTNGVLDLSLFPGRDDSGLLNKYLSYAEDNLDGFSLNTGIYFVFDQPIL